MKLIATKEEINTLNSQGLIEVVSDVPLILTLKLKTGLNNKTRTIDIECENIDDNQEEMRIDLSKLIDKSKKSITNEQYERFKECFPTTSIFKKLQPNEPDVRNLRTGNDDTCKAKLTKLMAIYTLDEIIEGVKHNVETLVNSQKLKYLKGMQTWLSDTSDVAVQIQEAKLKRVKPISNITKDKMI